MGEDHVPKPTERFERRRQGGTGKDESADSSCQWLGLDLLLIPLVTKWALIAYREPEREVPGTGLAETVLAGQSMNRWPDQAFVAPRQNYRESLEEGKVLVRH